MGRGWSTGSIAAAIAVIGAFAVPAAFAGSAVTFGELSIAYRQTTSNFATVPGRNEQQTYHPCDAGNVAGLDLISGGSWIADTAEPQPFRPGEAFLAGMQFRDLIVNGLPDSWSEVADVVANNDQLELGDVAVCAEVLGRQYIQGPNVKIAKRSRLVTKLACPASSTHVLGGGATLSGPFRSQRLISGAPFDSGDADATPDDGWRVIVDNMSGKRRQVSINLICAAQDGLSYRSKGFTVKAGKRAHADAQCATDTYAIGGGAWVKGGDRFKQGWVETRPDTDTGTSWNVALDNLGRKRFAARAFVICHA